MSSTSHSIRSARGAHSFRNVTMPADSGLSVSSSNRSRRTTDPEESNMSSPERISSSSSRMPSSSASTQTISPVSAFCSTRTGWVTRWTRRSPDSAGPGM
ncbi:hypothetical protein BJF78_13755 [Pseudonocardia sp. CNS-139]|nr:hypothetical protein BJF78_13755 [Pseudonocardia sp. CNS-139]